jgi:hypothetical protein
MTDQHKKCRKCGNNYCLPKYGISSYMLDYDCDVCGYLWSEYPVDFVPKREKTLKEEVDHAE